MLSPKKDEGDEKIPEPGLGENPSTHSVMTTQCGFWRVLGFIFFFFTNTGTKDWKKD